MPGERIWPQRLIPISLVIAMHGALIFAVAQMTFESRKQAEPVLVSLIVPSPASVEAPVPRPPLVEQAPLPKAMTQPQLAVTVPSGQSERAPAAITVESAPVPTAASDPAAGGSAPVESPATASAPAVAAKPSRAIVPPRFDAAYLNNPDPMYPRLSRRLGEQGKVLLRVYVSTAGIAEKVEIRTSSGSSRLDDAARAAVERWRFAPARQGDESVGAWLEVPISFVLKE